MAAGWPWWGCHPWVPGVMAEVADPRCHPLHVTPAPTEPQRARLGAALGGSGHKPCPGPPGGSPGRELDIKSSQERQRSLGSPPVCEGGSSPRGEALPHGRQGQGRWTSPTRPLRRNPVGVVAACPVISGWGCGAGSRQGLPRTAPQRTALQTRCSPPTETSDEVKQNAGEKKTEFFARRLSSPCGNVPLGNGFVRESLDAAHSKSRL